MFQGVWKSIIITCLCSYNDTVMLIEQDDFKVSQHIMNKEQLRHKQQKIQLN